MHQRFFTLFCWPTSGVNMSARLPRRAKRQIGEALTGASNIFTLRAKMVGVNAVLAASAEVGGNIGNGLKWQGKFCVSVL
jgi:hypothetical protein